ncbi:MAG: serine hydrolase domain-containing protein [Oscillospiraceae bacterium]
MYTTAAVMKLAEAGSLALDTPVKTYLPDFKMADERFAEITVRMFLNHSSGLDGLHLYQRRSLQRPGRNWPPIRLLERPSTQTLKASPERSASTATTASRLAQLVVEAVSGMDFDEYVQQAIGACRAGRHLFSRQSI